MESMSAVAMDYGTMGLFVAYLIYDRHVLLRKLTTAIEQLTRKLK